MAATATALDFTDHHDDAQALAAVWAADQPPTELAPRLATVPSTPATDALRALLAADGDPEAAVVVQVAAASVVFAESPERVAAAADDERARQRQDIEQPEIPALAPARFDGAEQAVALSVRIGVRLFEHVTAAARAHAPDLLPDLATFEKMRRTAFGFWITGMPKVLAVAEGRLSGPDAAEARARVAEVRFALALLHLGLGPASDRPELVERLLMNAATTFVRLGGTPEIWAADVDDIRKNGMRWLNRPGEDWKRFEDEVKAIQAAGASAALPWVDRMRGGLEQRLEGPPETQVFSEDLIARADEVVRRVATALGLDPEVALKAARAGALEVTVARAKSTTPPLAPPPSSESFWGRALAGGGLAAVLLVIKFGAKLGRYASHESAAPPPEISMATYRPIVADAVHHITSGARGVTQQSGLGPIVARLKVDDHGNVVDLKPVTQLSQGVVIAARRMKFDGGAGEFEVTWSE